MIFEVKKQTVFVYAVVLSCYMIFMSLAKLAVAL